MATPKTRAVNSKKPSGRPKGTGANMVYQGLRDDILALRLPPGENIEEIPLERRFKVSRTPVREALIRLASERLITIDPNQGARVSSIDISEIPQFFEALEICHRLVLRLSAKRRSESHLEELRSVNGKFADAASEKNVVAMSEFNSEFHLITANACGNKYICDLYQELQSIGLRLSRLAFRSALEENHFDEDYYKLVINQHDAMIDALSRRDSDEAERMGIVHTDLFRSRITRSMETNLTRDVDLSEAVA